MSDISDESLAGNECSLLVLQGQNFGTQLFSLLLLHSCQIFITPDAKVPRLKNSCFIRRVLTQILTGLGLLPFVEGLPILSRLALLPHSYQVASEPCL